MILNILMEQKNMSMYKLAKISNVPYATINDIYNKKAQLEKCAAETIYKIAKALDVSMEMLLEPYMEQRSTFDVFKSNVCHRVKELGDWDFIIEVLEKDHIRMYYNRNWYAECFYLLAMLDYLSRLNEVPLCSQYDDLRKYRLQEPVYPSSVLMAAAVSENSADVKMKAQLNSIPEFMRFNIVESEVRNVI